MVRHFKNNSIKSCKGEERVKRIRNAKSIEEVIDILNERQ